MFGNRGRSPSSMCRLQVVAFRVMAANFRALPLQSRSLGGAGNGRPRGDQTTAPSGIGRVFRSDVDRVVGRGGARPSGKRVMGVILDHSYVPMVDIPVQPGATLAQTEIVHGDNETTGLRPESPPIRLRPSRIVRVFGDRDARLLPRFHDWRAVVVRDPELGGVSARRVESPQRGEAMLSQGESTFSSASRSCGPGRGAIQWNSLPTSHRSARRSLSKAGSIDRT